ncbi:Wadjet anti-phage system protein JetD domain-containing protein [Ornithinibacter sp.]|uniref:Wadjet anti-phage system protein JetD domain-containing protein n=1 Tax=Ornithinibacter sp. TaxID=2862748 RepID=UPI002B818C45|nr:Wadjet anti-phage system protein JetD domain-containing protein [Ornithinibacter sp.]HRA26537.1 DUF2220 family protein [Ornithinibacter sp.]
MKSVAEVRVVCRDRLVRRMGEWAGALVTPDAGPPRFTIPLHPPTEKEMLADESAAEEWARKWASFPLPDGVEVEWDTRVWRSIGRQQVPVRVLVRDADGAAALAGGAAQRDWLRLRSRALVVAARFGDTADVARTVRLRRATLVGYSDVEFGQVVDVAAWVIANPITGLRPRQVPVRGVDSKWLGHHRAIVRDLVGAVTGSVELGLVESDPLIRLRILDPTLSVGGLRDVAAPPQQVAALPLAPRGVIVVENLESVLAMPDLPGAVVIHGSGFAVDRVASIPWVVRVPILYWGDLDSHGFAILHRLRLHHPAVTSVLMDEATLLAHRDLWVPDPHPTRAALDGLTGEERAALARLRTEGDVRLEQERIPWRQALAAIRAAWEGELDLPVDRPGRRGTPSGPGR